MKVLLTGSSGFAGKHILQFLNTHKRVDEVHCIIRKKENMKWDNDHLVDLLDKTELRRVVDEIQPDTIIHLAGSAAGKPGQYPLIQFEENVRTTYNLLDVCPKNSRFIFTSSVVVYGDTAYRAAEDYPCKPKSFYATSKLACEGLVHTFAATNGIKSHILRLPALIGKGLTHGILKAHLDKVFSSEKTLNIIGDSYGGAKKPYLHIDDLNRVIGFILSDLIPPDIYNLAPADELTSHQVASLVIHYTGINKNIVMEDKNWPTDNLILQVHSSKLLGSFDLKYPTSKLAMIQGIKDNLSDYHRR